MIVYRDKSHRDSCGSLSILFRDLYKNYPSYSSPVSTIEAYSRILFDNFNLFAEKVKKANVLNRNQD